MAVSKKERNEHMRIVQGVVVSDKMMKTRVIRVETMKQHPLFKKSIRRTKRIKIHDEREESGMGDIVSAVETRPLSGDKRHRLLKILKKSLT